MKNSPNTESQERGKYLSLIHQFRNLDKDWKSFEKSRPKNPRNTCSTISDNCSTITSLDHHQLLDNSPRVLMSSLQQRRTPNSDGVVNMWVIRGCNNAVEEILMDIIDAITSGKLKGRRLFREDEEELDLNCGGDSEICSEWYGIQEKEVMVNEINCSGKRLSPEMPLFFSEENKLKEHNEWSDDTFNQSFSSSDFSVSNDKAVVEEEKMVVEVAEKRGGSRNVRGGGRWMVAVTWFGLIVLIIVVTLWLISMSCNGKFVQEDQLVLVPT